MCELSLPRRTAGSALTALIFVCTSFVSAAHPDAAILETVEVLNSSSENCHIALEIRGRVDRIETTRLADGRFVFDLEPVAWDGPTRRVRPDLSAIHEYRYSQFSRSPLVTRFVVEVESGWSCRHDFAPGGVIVSCSGPAIGEAQRSTTADSTIAVVRGIKLYSPLAALDAERLVDRSLGYTPRDMMRDGLPHFGSTRDDWKDASRPHKGIDIYVDKTFVQAVAKGRVVGVGDGARAGGWVKIDHGKGVETVYVHVSEMRVSAGDNVARCLHIATIDGASGNAVEPQLHFELRLDGESVDPVPYIYELASEGLKRKITLANQRLEVLEQERAARVRQMPGASGNSTDDDR
jgi:hypothetical protein